MRELVKALQHPDSPIGYLIFKQSIKEKDWVCWEVNQRAQVFLEQGELISKTWKEIFQISLDAISNHATLPIKDNKWLSVSVMNGSTADIRIVVLTNITEQESRILDLEKKVERLKNSNKDLEHFAYVASHDLREPLRKIGAFSERLNKKYAEVLEGNGLIYLNRMIDATQRMQTFIDDLLMFSKFSRDTSEKTDVDLNETLRGVLSDFEMQIDSNKASVKSQQLPVIKGVKTQMAQLFQNLVGNALKFKNPNMSPNISIECMESKNDYYISISDNGIGFEAADAERVFTLFQRLNGRSEYEGTGIGLAICKKIVENHGGTITAQGKPNKGAVFTIILPKD